MSRYSRYEKLSKLLSRDVLTSVTTRPGCGTGYGLKISASTMLKVAALIPIPRASVITTNAESAGARRRLRIAYRTSSMKSVSQCTRRMSRISSFRCASPSIARSAR